MCARARARVCMLYTYVAATHSGFLCGTCPAGTAVSLDLQSCSDQCGVGIAVFIIMCKCMR